MDAVKRAETATSGTAADLRSRALRLLSRREYSRVELRRRLRAHAEPVEIETLLDHLSAGGWLSDARVVEQFVHAKRDRFGSLRIAQELRERGVADDEISREMPRLREGDLDAARALWRRKFGNPPGTAKERARQERFLRNRGFAAEVVRQVLRGRLDGT